MGHLTPDVVLRAYAAGAFPMADARESAEQDFYLPVTRGVLDLDQVRVPRRLARRLRRHPFSFAIDQDFGRIVRTCAEIRRTRQNNTWINGEIERVFGELHRLGQAHCLGAYEERGQLVGGLYGLHLGSLFFGESMFSQASDASKACLVALFAVLKNAGFSHIDAQLPNQHLRQFGLQDWPNEAFLSLLARQESQRRASPSFPSTVDARLIDRFLGDLL